MSTENGIMRDLQSDSEDDEGNDLECAVTHLVDVELTPPTTVAANEAMTTLERYLISRCTKESVLSASKQLCSNVHCPASR